MNLICDLFIIFRFKGCRKDEVLGIANNRLIRIDLSVDEVVKTWRYNTMKQWNVNWDIKQVGISESVEKMSCFTHFGYIHDIKVYCYTRVISY